MIIKQPSLQTVFAVTDELAANIEHPNHTLLEGMVVWQDPRTFPLYISVLSSILLGVTLFHRRKRSITQKSLSSLFPDVHQQQVLSFILEALRFLCCAALGLLSSVSRHKDDRAIPYWIYPVVFTYSGLLSLCSIISNGQTRWLVSKHVSAVQFTSLAVIAYRDGLSLASGLPPPDDSPDHRIWIQFGLLLFTGLIAPLLIPRPYIPADCQNPATPAPEETASYLSLMLHLYMDRTVYRGCKNKIKAADDLPALLGHQASLNLKEDSYPYFQKLLESQKGSLLWAILRYFKAECVAMLLLSALEAVNRFSGPIAILHILGYLEADDTTGWVRPWAWLIWLLLGPIIVSAAFNWLLYIKSHMLASLEAILTQAAFNHAISIRINTASVDSTKTPADGHGEGEDGVGKKDCDSPVKEASQQAGQINNLLTVDLKKISAVDFHPLMCIFRLIGCFVFLYDVLGWSSLVGSTMLIVTLPIPGYIIKLREGVQVQKMKKSDSRLQSVIQSTKVLRTIKLFGWESFIEEKISSKRAEELAFIWKSDTMDLILNLTTAIFPIASMVASYACFALIARRPLNPSVLFSTITVFRMVEANLGTISHFAPTVIRGKVALDRMATFFRSGDRISSAPYRDAASNQVSQSDMFICNSEFAWSSDGFDGINMSRKFSLRVQGLLAFIPGRLNVVTGPTASGKTSLLMALLGEMVFRPSEKDGGFNLPRSGGVAYAAQESWVMNQTIKDNILFGSEYDELRYKRVLDQTALSHDIASFDAGDLTEVGENGVTLSGGQKARVTLARAVYSKSQIVLLDDILSALDVHTAKWIVHKCLAGDLLQGRTVVLVTHHVTLVRSIAAYLISLDNSGSIATHGPVESVLRNHQSLLVEASEEILGTSEIPKEATLKHPEVTETSKGKLIADEEVAIGRVGWVTLKFYLSRLGGPFFYINWIGSLIFYTCVSVIQTWFVGYWSSQYDRLPVEQVNVKLYLSIYALISLCNDAFGLASYAVYLWGLLKAAKVIHGELVHSVVSSTWRWLDTVPISRVIARFAADIEFVDSTMGSLLDSFAYQLITVVVSASTIVVVAGIPMLAPTVAFISLGVLLGYTILAARMPVKRLLSNARAPILAQLQTALVGLVSVRAFGAQAFFRSAIASRLDVSTRISNTFSNLNRWHSVRTEILGSVFGTAIASWLVYGRPARPETIGFTLSLLTGFHQTLMGLVGSYNDLEVETNSIERIRQYLSIDHEPEPTHAGVPAITWPSTGSLEVHGLSARYSVDGADVLKNIAFNVKSGERIGVVGRTGAGKSTLGLALLRALPVSGTVRLDGCDVSTLNLDVLRSNVTIIPQHPELLTGTVRENIDPRGKYDDVVLSDALKSAGLFSSASKSESGVTLDSVVESDGSNFSHGQRQMVALARAVVRKSKLLIMDEATSAIDFETDKAIQDFLRNEARGVTLITIAHRLRTIMDYDKIMVLDAGQLVEWGTPKELLAAKGYFYSLVDESNEKEELYNIAMAAQLLPIRDP